MPQQITKPITKQNLVDQIHSKSTKQKVAQSISHAIAQTPPSVAATIPNHCHELHCENEIMASGYCRMHYIRNWRKIKRKELILKERKLNAYIEELVNKYPERYIEAIRQDLLHDNEFAQVIRDLEIVEAEEGEIEDADAIDSMLESIRKDIVDVDDEGDAF